MSVLSNLRGLKSNICLPCLSNEGLMPFECTITPAFCAFRVAQWRLQVEDLEVYEPAVAEEEALPEPEAAPAAKGECGL